MDQQKPEAPNEVLEELSNLPNDQEDLPKKEADSPIQEQIKQPTTQPTKAVAMIKHTTTKVKQNRRQIRSPSQRQRTKPGRFKTAKPTQSKTFEPANEKISQTPVEKHPSTLFYYEIGDLVFAKSEKGYLQPAIVVKVTKNYSLYGIQFMDSPKHKQFAFDDLKDYDQQNIKRYLKLAEILPNAEAAAVRKNAIAAEKKQKALSQKAERQRFKSLLKKHNEIQSNLLLQKVNEILAEEGISLKKYKTKAQKAKVQKRINDQANRQINKFYAKLFDNANKQINSNKNIAKERNDHSENQSSSYEIEVLKPQVVGNKMEEELPEFSSPQFSPESQQSPEANSKSGPPKMIEISLSAGEAKDKASSNRSEISSSAKQVVSLRYNHSADYGRSSSQNVQSMEQSPPSVLVQSKNEELFETASVKSLNGDERMEVTKTCRVYSRQSKKLEHLLKNILSKPARIQRGIAESILEDLIELVTNQCSETKKLEMLNRFTNDLDLLVGILNEKREDASFFFNSKIIIKSFIFVSSCRIIAGDTVNQNEIQFIYNVVQKFLDHWATKRHEITEDINGNKVKTIRYGKSLQILQCFEKKLKNRHD